MKGFNVLVVDTTGEPLSLALRARGKLYSFHRALKQPHDETLLKRVDSLLARAEIGLDELDAIAAASGPGRFTGIRIGMAYAAVAAGALGKRALAVSRLEAAAHRGTQRLVAAVVPGWRDEKFCQLFERRGARLVAVEPAAWLDPGSWPAERARLAAQGAELVEADPTAEDLLRAAESILAGGRVPPFEPLYLKPAGYEAKRQARPAR